MFLGVLCTFIVLTPLGSINGKLFLFCFVLDEGPKKTLNLVRSFRSNVKGFF